MNYNEKLLKVFQVILQVGRTNSLLYSHSLHIECEVLQQLNCSSREMQSINAIANMPKHRFEIGHRKYV